MSAARLDGLRAVNAELRREIRDQLDRWRLLRRFYAAAGIEQQLLFWQHYALSADVFGPPGPTKPPPRQIPPDMLDRFTMGGRVPIEDNYLDATYPSNWPLIYTDFEIDTYLERLRRGDPFIYGQTDLWLWEALAKYPIKGLDVVHMGSLTPWYEATCLHFGGRSTTIDYNPIITLTERIRTMTVAQWNEHRPRFDVAWSISSFEHDGLGMYGDPLDPDGDLKAMQRMKTIVKPGGLLFLSLPVGRDRILFNNARIYGRLRLPLLVAGWKQLQTFGLRDSDYDGPGHLQPLIVLRNDRAD